MLVLCLLACMTNVFANVNVTSAGNLNLCVGTTYTTIGDITIQEGGATDFSTSANVQSYEINAPSNFEFSPGNGSVTATGTDITFSAVTVTASKITLYYLINATASTDKFVLSNIKIRATNYSGNQNIVRTGGDAVQAGNNAYGSTHATVSANKANVNLSASSKVVCANGSDINLSSNTNGGSYSVSPSSAGLTGNTFKPALAGSGLYIITYTATDNGCSGTDTVHITIKPVPTVTFFGLASSYCSNAADVTLSGFPSGGSFSGSGISGTATFKPSTAGVGNNKSITYQYTGTNGCQNNFTSSTNILQAPSVSITLIPDRTTYSNSEDSILISGTQSNPSIGGTINVSGNGVSVGSDGNARFYPNIIGSGTSTITRTLTALNSCSASSSKTVSVSATNSTTISGLGNTYCVYQSAVAISVPNGKIGRFEGPGIIDVFPMDNVAIFDPAQVSPIYFNSQFPIIFYEFISILGGYYPTAIQNVAVYDMPSVTIIKLNSNNTNNEYCSNANSVDLSVVVSPTGGVGSFSGPGVSGSTFNPQSVIGDNTIIYSYTDIHGCVNSSSIVMKVKLSPSNVGFTGMKPQYCSSDSASVLTVNGNITPVGGVGKFMGVGVDSNSYKLPIFGPSVILNSGLLSKPYVVTYIYTTSEGCSESFNFTTVVNKSPEVHLFGLTTNTSGEYCTSAADINLNPTPLGGNISITAKTQAAIVDNPLQISPSLKFQPSKGVPDVYYLKYSYEDGNDCTNSIIDTVILNALPTVAFTSLDPLYCIYDNDVFLDGYPSGGNYSSVDNTASITSNKFRPNGSGVGKHVLTYSYTDGNGCSSSVTKTTKVYGRPTTQGKDKTIKLSTACEGDLITFSDFSASLDISNEAESIIETADWKFDNIKYSNDFGIDTTFRLAAGAHVVTYKLTTDKGCFTQFDSTVIVGSYPETGFTWDKICNKEYTKFINTTSIVQGKVTNVVWDFGDGNTPITIQTVNAEDGDTSHKFQNASDDLPSTYTVILKATTDYNCVYSETQKVFILPSQRISSTTPYVNDFNLNNGGWVASSPGDSLLSWVLNSPNKKIIKSTNPAWVTNATKAFKPAEISYVYSPCFTLGDDITKPMIHMDIWSGTRKDIAGANLQYSIDGTNFFPLGKANASGINWYNNASNIESRPSGVAALDQNGWTGIDSVGWKNARHIFDNEIGTNKNIRFRISFAASSDTTTDGFAFDNVWIGDRTRLILAEHFTNNTAGNTVYENDTLNKLIAANLLNNQPKDIVKLEYHTAFPGTDQMNVRNIPDAGARSLYYGVTQIPYTTVDGSYFKGNTLRVNQNVIDTRSLYDPAFDVLLATSLSASTNTISGSITIKNKIPVNNNVTVYISLLERFVNGVPGSNGESSYQWVHAKFLPDAAGTTFAPNWATQNSQVVNFNWNFGTSYLYNSGKLAIIAFVQDNVTKEIYQAAYKGIGAAVATGVFDPVEATSTVTLYPNPANDITTVILNGKLAGEYNWVIIDELGRTVGEGALTDGTDGFTINTQNYASGFYTLRLSNGSDGVKTQKFVVVH